MNKLQLYEQNYLKHIKEADLLPENLSQKIKHLIPELKHNHMTQTIWRTNTEIRCSVLNDKDFPDKAAKYHQAKLEQMVFFEQLLNLSFEYRKNQEKLTMKEADIEGLEYKLANDDLLPHEKKKLEARLNIKNIEKEEILLGLQNMQVQAKERVREIEIWSQIKEELDDGTFDKDNKDNNQLLSMTRRYIQEAFNVVTLGQNSDISSVNNIMAQFESLCKECIHRGLFDEVLNHFHPQSNIVKWVSQVFNLKEVVKR